MAADSPVIPLQECRRFIQDCLVAVFTSRENATAVAECLVEADHRGFHSYGINRLATYVNDIKAGVCHSSATPEIIKQTPATAWVNGNNGLGPIIATFCMKRAIEKAKNVGIGFVVCQHSSQFGFASYYSLQAMKEGMIGLSFTNSSPAVAPPGAKHVALGRNHLSLAAPGVQGDCFVLDTTSTVAGGKSDTKKGACWMNAESKALGTDDSSCSCKGYGLAMMVETLCGILGGGTFGPYVRKSLDVSKPAGYSHCFIAINPKCFVPGFKHRLSELMDYLRHMEPTDSNKAVSVAGDAEREHMKAVDEAGGVRFNQEHLDSYNKLAKSLRVKPLSIK